MSSAGITVRGLRRGRFLVRIASSSGVIGLVVGTPTLMLCVHAVPPVGAIASLALHPTHISRVVTGRLDDVDVSRLVSTAAWLAWSWLILCLAVEVSSRIRGRSAGRIPASRYVQSLATFLVGASLAVGAPGRHVAPLRLQAVDLEVTTAHNRDLATALTMSRSKDAGVLMSTQCPIDDDEVPVSPTIPQSGRRYVVQPRDTLWSIAKRELGSPLEWRQIAELNYGCPQPGGEALTDDHWIQPGWTLVLPTSPGPPTSTGPTEPSVTVQPEGPGREVAYSVGQVGRSASVREMPDRALGSSAPRIPVVPIGYGLLGAGIVVLLDRMRRAQQRMRPTGLRIALPAGDLQELERGLRVAADPGSVEWVDLSLRLLSVIVRRCRATPPPISAVRLREDAVELLLDGTGEIGPPPPPFERGEHDGSWVLRRSRERIESLRLDPEVMGHDAPLPALVTLGRDDSGIFMINIERAGSVAVSGPDADPLVEGIVVELATASWADQMDLMLVGFGNADETFERVVRAGSLRAAGQSVERRARERKALLGLAEQSTNAETRWLDGGDAWDLCVVICSPEAAREEPDAVETIARIAGDGSLGVAIISGCDVPTARWHIRAEGGRVSIVGTAGARASLARQRVPRNFVEGVAALVSVAANTEGVLPNEAPYDALLHPMPASMPGVDDRAAEAGPSHEERHDARAGEVQVGVLGPVRISGAARPFTRAWAIELIVYLVMHPVGASNEQWVAALWPDRAMAPASQHSTASAARRSLGTTASGDDHLPRARGRLALGPSVRSDWATFETLALSPTPDDWKDALNLIRGRPFDGLRSPDWVVLEGILATVEAVVVDVACRYAERCLAVLDSAGAEWAARQGLRVSPYDERLYRVLLRAADAAGNPAGVEAVMAELVHLVADDVEPFDAVHPETLALYRSLSRRSFVSRSR